jgi:glycerol-3-phosphate dehydrogenase
MPVEKSDLPAVDGVGEESIALLMHRYGYAARDVLAVADERPELAQRIVADLPDLMAEVVIAARAEQAHSVGDVLLRRTRLGLLDAPALCAPGAEAPRAVAQVLGAELGWDEARCDAEAAAWQEEARAEGVAAEGVAAG